MSEEPKSIWTRPFGGRVALVVWAGLVSLILALGLHLFTTDNFSLPLTAWAGPAGGVVLAGFAIFLMLVFIVWPLGCLMWRHWRRTLFGVACLVTLIALFYAEEDWRGKRAWLNYKQEWEAKGEKYDLKDFVPPPVPDEQNFAMAPVVASSYAAVIDKTGHEVSPRNTNVINRLEWTTSNPNDGNTAPTNADWACGTVTDLKAWQAYYRNSRGTNLSTRAVTNYFPVSPQPQSPSEDVLLALSKYEPDLKELRAAAKLPESRFPLEYDKENPAMILLPHLAAMKRSSLVIQLRAIAELQSGQSDQALTDIKLNFRLLEAIHSEPFIISQLVRYAMLQLTLQPIYEGLAEHQWTDAQLEELEEELAKLDCLTDYANSIRCEPVAHIKLIDYMERSRKEGVKVLKMMDDFDRRKSGITFRTFVLFYLAPKGWFYQNELRLAQLNRQLNQPIVDATQGTVAPKMAAENKAAEAKLVDTPYGFLVRTLLPWLGTFVQKAALAQNATDLARVALALERHRLAQGDYPETLDALAPKFITQLPHDVIGGGPLRYRRTEDGRFVLYSIGWNERDDGGVAIFNKGSNDTFGSFVRDEGDWVWEYPKK